VATVAAAGSFFSPVLDLDRVEVQGVDGAREAQVREAAAVSEGEAMVAIDPAEVRSRLEELAFVAHARVRLDWPDRLVLSVAAHRPAALLATGDAEATHVLTRAADVVPVQDVEAAELRVVRLDRPPSELDERERLALAALLTSLGPASEASLGPLDRSADGRYRFGGAGGIEGAEVVVGEMDGLARKAQALEAMLGGAVELDCLQRLDVSVPARVIVTRDPACTVPAVG
jgi:cell division protein FtsQ